MTDKAVFRLVAESDVVKPVAVDVAQSADGV